MARKKRYRGHFCKVCGEVLPNEKFTGKGHAAHICKMCAGKPLEGQQEEIVLTRIGGVYRYPNLSRQNRLMLEKYTRTSPRQFVRQRQMPSPGSRKYSDAHLENMWSARLTAP